MATLVFAAERRAAAPLLLNAGRVIIDRYFLADGLAAATPPPAAVE